MEHPFDEFIAAFAKSDWHPDLEKRAGEKGVHAPLGPSVRGGGHGISDVGRMARRRVERSKHPESKNPDTLTGALHTQFYSDAVSSHKRVLSEQRSMPKPKLPG